MAAEPSRHGLPYRLVRLLSRIAQRYADVAQQELLNDVRRLVFAVFVVGMALVTGAHLLAVMHVFLVWALVQVGVPALAVLGGLLVVDALGTALLLRAAMRSLAQPLLPQTRAQLADLAVLLSDE